MYNTTNTPTVLQTHTMLNPQDPAVQIMHYNTLRSIQQSYNPVPLSTLNSLPVRYVQMDQLLRNPAQDQFVSTMTMAPVVGMSINQPQMNMQQIPKIQMQPQIPTPAQIQQITNTVKMQQQRFETPTLNMKQLSSIDMLKSYPEVFRRDSLSNSELLRSAAILPTQPLSRISTDVDTSSPLFDGVMLFEQENRSSKNRSSSSYRWKKVSPDVHRRSRLYSGSSCYESDASDNSSDDLQVNKSYSIALGMLFIILLTNINIQACSELSVQFLH
ncbi:unnamed protein product [Didymodactylos carnosus]|uniref:Uncharacterized protein n=1 Tax=Didymodactylos carnosus TaxID=1234261 RepID=A0A814M8Z0_9BILA|nr:unnamed protein product [Didymodactylos carnosus]CAF1076148.1 unnamed protein product [Didymodactylos carnosus]CAF3755011.1 unnamed protein product [Didymodactylos carnosus]CAF3842676.1 unnamed protein product [Didymodactylos carnosus]